MTGRVEVWERDGRQTRKYSQLRTESVSDTGGTPVGPDRKVSWTDRWSGVSEEHEHGTPGRDASAGGMEVRETTRFSSGETAEGWGVGCPYPTRHPGYGDCNRKRNTV